ncbi:MAG: alpha/beta hydrolase [Armatimonadota bacterium]|nr:MAG: alpha/beta hydrolase [Armatimonadota bacterium]
MLRRTLFAALAITAVGLVPRAAPAGEDAAVRIVSPADGAVVALGEPVAIEITVDRLLEGCPFSLRVDGKSVWVGQQSYRKSFESSDWGPGRHWLQAAVFKGDDEIKSPLVWMTVEAPEREPAPQPEEPPQESPEATLRLLPTPKTTSPAQGFQLPFSDGFDDEALARSVLAVFGPDPGIEAVESQNEVRVSGVSTRGTSTTEGVITRRFPKQSVQASVWFRAPELGCDDKCWVLLFLKAGEESFQVYFNRKHGYTAGIRTGGATHKWVEAYGDETAAWHKLTAVYDANAGTAQGYVDDFSLGSFPVALGRLLVGFGVATRTAGCPVDVRFDDFEVKPLGPEAEPPATSAAIPDEEPGWDRDPWLGPDDPIVRGQIVERRTPHGDYFEYVPLKLSHPVCVVVVVHGSRGDNEMGLEVSRVSARWSLHERGWLLLADTKGVILVAPSFDRERYYGYRYLWGSPVTADRFVLEIVDGYRERFRSADGKIVLFGHSAGGQFAQRFLLAHPDRVLAAVISSAGTYAYPDDSVDWPFGRRNSANPEGFLAAAALPVRVVVGSLDTADARGDGRAQRGLNRVERGQSWMQAMRDLAWENGFEPGVELVVVPGALHSDWRLDISSVWWLASIIDADRAEQQPRRDTAPAFPGIPTFPDIPAPY